MDYIGSTVVIPEAGWVTLVSQSVADAYRGIRRAGILFGLSALGALLLSVVFSLARAAKLTRPLSELSSRARLIAGGDYELSFSETDYLEVKALAESFLSMTAAIRERERQLVESRESYRILVETMNDGLVAADRDGLITYLNPRLAEMLGYSSESMTGRRLADFFDDRNRPSCVIIWRAGRREPTR